MFSSITTAGLNRSNLGTSRIINRKGGGRGFRARAKQRVPEWRAILSPWMSSTCAISTPSSLASWRGASSAAASARAGSDTHGLRVLGVGYATPYLGLFREEAERCLALMPAPQGVVRWPSTRPALAALVEEDELPLTDSAVDRVLLVHALEMSADPAELLREAWRVLAAGGRLLAVVPNRRGLWARMDTTPFGQGRPYSRTPDHAAAARHLVHADRLGRGALRAADRARLVSAFGGGLGAHRRDAVGAVCRRAYRRSDQAGLSRHPGAARKAPARSGAQAGAGARRRAPRRCADAGTGLAPCG